MIVTSARTKNGKKEKTRSLTTLFLCQLQPRPVRRATREDRVGKAVAVGAPILCRIFHAEFPINGNQQSDEEVLKSLRLRLAQMSDEELLQSTGDARREGLR
jgi:hypothetical protein